MTETSTYTHQELSARLAEVERERDELAAMVGRLRHIAKESQGWNWLSAWEEAEDAGEVNLLVPDMQALVDAFDSIDEPTALAEIRAEAGTAGYLKGFRDYCSRMWPSEQEFIDGPLAQYAQQLRNGGE